MDLYFHNCYKEINSSRWWLDEFTFYSKNYKALIQQETNIDAQIPYRLMMIGSNTFQDNFASAMNFQSVNGYNPIEPDRYNYFKSIVLEKMNKSFLDLSGIKLISVSKSTDDKNELLDDDIYPKIFEDNYWEFRKNLSVLPRLFLVQNFVYDSDPEKTLTNIETNDYHNNFNEIAVIEDNTLLKLSRNYDEQTQTHHLNSPLFYHSQCYNHFFNTKYKNNYIEIDLRNSCSSLLVLTDNYFSGWSAFVDGIEHEIYRTDYFFRSVYVEPGKHHIEFKYLPLRSSIKLKPN
jgi:hypothetical protein